MKTLTTHCIADLYSIYKQSIDSRKVSYIPFLAPIDKILEHEKQGCCPYVNKMLKRMGFAQRIKEVNASRYTKLSTGELLRQAKALLENPRLKAGIKQRDIMFIKNEISTREDVFGLVLANIRHIPLDTRNELHYWTPGLKIADFFSFLLSIMPHETLMEKYKEIVVQEIITGVNPSFGLVNVLAKRISPEYFIEIDVIKEDPTYLAGIKNCVIAKDEIKKTNKPVIKYKNYYFKPETDIPIEKRMMTHPFWCPEYMDCDMTEIRLLPMLGVQCTHNASKYFQTFLLSAHSFLEIEVGGNVEIVSFKEFYALLVKDETYKEFWEAKGIDWGEEIAVC